MGVEQTEIDALAALRPELLEQLVRQAINPFFDTSLDGRVRAARHTWLAEAQARLEEQLDHTHSTVSGSRQPISSASSGTRSRRSTTRSTIDIYDSRPAPEIVVPDPELNRHANEPRR